MIRVSLSLALPAALLLAACETYAPPAPGATPYGTVSGGQQGEGPAAESTILEIQQRLNSQGYDAGPEDGIMGPRTRTAIQAYQADHALVPDGVPDEDLIQRLRAGVGERRSGEPSADNGGWVDPSV